MIQLNTILNVTDNSGVKTLKCIKIFGGSFIGYIGDIITTSIQKVIPHKKIRSGEVHKALIIRTSKETNRQDGSSIRFFSNSAIILTEKETPYSTRIFGPVPKELRTNKFMKVVSISQGTI